MLDVLSNPDGLDYRFRLTGTLNVKLVGRDPTGRRAFEIFGTEEHQYLMRTFDTTVAEASATFWRAEVPQDRLGTVQICRGLFPLSEDGIVVNMLLCIAVPG